MKVKSISTVLMHNEWVVRIRNTDGSEQVDGIGAHYTMHQAEMFADSVRRQLADSVRTEGKAVQS